MQILLYKISYYVNQKLTPLNSKILFKNNYYKTKDTETIQIDEKTKENTKKQKTDEKKK